MDAIPYKYRNLKLRMLANPSSVVELDPLLIINSITESPTFRYNGKDANASTFPPWGYGASLALQAGTVPTYNDGSPCLGVDDDSVKFNGGGYYKNPNAVNQIGTEDFVIELIIKGRNVTERVGGSFFTTGYLVYTTTSGTGNINLHMQDSGGGLVVASAASSVPMDTWNHCILFVNRDETSNYGARWYINGGLSGNGQDVSSISDTLISSAFVLGAGIVGQVPFSNNIAYAAMWKRANMLQAGAAGQAEAAVIAAERFAQASGMFPQKAIGTSLATVKTRAFSAYLRKQQGSVIKLYRVGSEWLRMESLDDKNGVNKKGYLAEPQIKNLLYKSEDFAGWTKIIAGDIVTNNVAVCPDGRTAAASLVACSTGGQHGVYDVAPVTAATHTFSVYAEPGDKDWVKLENTTDPDCWCYFDVMNGAVGTSGAAATGYIDGPFYGGALGDFYRCSIVWMVPGGPPRILYVKSAQADGDDIFAGDGATVNTYLWGAQCEANDRASSPIITDGGTVTRLHDQLRFKGDDGNITNNGQGTIVMDVLYSEYTNQANKYLLSLDDGTSADSIMLFASANNIRANTAATAGNPGNVNAPGDIFDGDKHEIRLQWETDNLIISRDGVEGTPDISCDMPLGLSHINIETHHASGGHAQCLLSNIRIYSEPTTRG